jgi:hypothetical protein
MSHTSQHSTPSTAGEPVSPGPSQNLVLLQVAYVRREQPELDLPRGACGTIVEIFDRPQRAYYVEFVDNEGRTTAEGAITADELSAVLPGSPLLPTGRTSLRMSSRAGERRYEGEEGWVTETAVRQHS